MPLIRLAGRRPHVTLHKAHKGKAMPRGASGRLVIEIDPSLKQKLYTALAAENVTLKDWFIRAATQFVAEREQPVFPEVAKNPKGRRRQ